MGTTTAVILVGNSHPNEGGINPTHLIQVVENSRPRVFLQSLDGSYHVAFLPSNLDDIVHDIYLLTAIHILKKIKTADEIYDAQMGTYKSNLNENDLKKLYADAHQVFSQIRVKMVFNIFLGSSLGSMFDLIKGYPPDFEVTLSTMSKEYNDWKQTIQTTGI